ncbi:hypothetical protein E4S40_02185 [Algoriphagus kandeliae]|uniref:Uncharacterized protein n=1 Tax=Algoriphagus kandeliae TaxID=2562278 RepID=A0A4Y9R267_9BACT|nr:hypothetical protein [Algoriphagus kandeliae]TFV97486.1 hypothetical protein E4S40_02185 [Algoriphagus kandeliae]
MRKFFFQFAVIILLIQLFSTELLAQRNDYIVLNDTIFSEGYIKQEYSEITSTIYFRKTKKEPWNKYSNTQVKEYYFSKRKYYAKEIERGNGREFIFLKLIPNQLEGVNLYRSTDQKMQFFLEKEGSIQLLDESYREVLRQTVANAELDPLLEITHFTGEDMAYFLSEAGTFKKPRTYSKRVGVTPFSGVIQTINRFQLPNTNQLARVTGAGWQLGTDMEIQVNRLRNVSLHLRPSFSSSSGSDFIIFRDGGNAFETDSYLSQTIFQLPLSGKFHLDLVPNSWRAFGEVGYGISFINLQESSLQIAEIQEGSVTTYVRDFELNGLYNGFVGGLGIEKYLSKGRALIIGIHYSSMSSGVEKFAETSMFVGFKF